MTPVCSSEVRKENKNTINNESLKFEKNDIKNEASDFKPPENP